MGVPPVFIEARGGAVSLSTDVIGTVVNGAINQHVESINAMLRHVCETLFGTMSDLVNRPMLVQLKVKHEGLELDDSNKKQKLEKDSAPERSPTPSIKEVVKEVIGEIKDYKA